MKGSSFIPTALPGLYVNPQLSGFVKSALQLSQMELSTFGYKREAKWNVAIKVAMKDVRSLH